MVTLSKEETLSVCGGTSSNEDPWNEDEATQPIDTNREHPWDSD